jgi:hypothetical protein
LKVTGERPDWSVNPADYEQSMTIAGQLRIEGLPQEDSHDLLAAFINDSCAGLVSPKYEAAYQSYFVYLQVWGNTSDEGKDITFKIWDASTGVIYPSVNVSLSGTPLSLSYAGNGIKGSPDVPVVFDAREYVEQSIKVNTGWNWVSFNLVSASLQDANSLMRKVNNGVEIKGQAANAFSRYNVNSNYWTNGTLNGRGINPVNMYMVLMSGNNTILVPGLPLNPDTTNIRLVQGWNWIAYIPQVNQTVTEAFSGANPAVGDLVKSQTDFSIFSSQSGWVGTLDYLRPGIGYMYQTTTSRSFKYPRGGGVLTRSSGSDGVAFIPEAPASINAGIAPNYESNLSFIGTVRISSDNLSPSARLIAKAGSECRGVAEITKVGDKQLFFLPVFSNSTGVETITFVLENNGREIPLKETIRFKRDAIVGALEAPVQLSEMDIRLKAYPNPFIDKINVSFEIDDPKADVRIELISMTGAVIYSTVHRITTAGYQEMSITGAAVNNLVEGTYIIRVTVNNSETFTNIVIKERY